MKSKTELKKQTNKKRTIESTNRCSSPRHIRYNEYFGVHNNFGFGNKREKEKKIKRVIFRRHTYTHTRHTCPWHRRGKSLTDRTPRTAVAPDWPCRTGNYRSPPPPHPGRKKAGQGYTLRRKKKRQHFFFAVFHDIILQSYSYSVVATTVSEVGVPPVVERFGLWSSKILFGIPMKIGQPRER